MIRAVLVAMAIVGVVCAQAWAEESPFTSAVPGRVFSFPRDHGKHPDFQTEWWYFTGNVKAADKSEWGFQLTFFRRSLLAQRTPRRSSWAIRDVYPAHFALTDITANRFFHTQILSREGPGLASAASDDLNVQVKDWSARQDGDVIHLRAAQDGYRLDLSLVPTKPVVLHGNAGFSRKGDTRNQASYYYSFTRLAVSGSIEFRGKAHDVRGFAWMDHEFGSSILLKDQAGWDWFSLQLDDGTDVMVFHLRKQDGSTERPFGTFVPRTGVPEDLDGRSIVITPGEMWTSPHTKAQYPLTWTVKVPDKKLSLEVTPLIRDQELASERGAGIAYWEGAVSVKGLRDGKSVRGRGYMELTGYARSLGGSL